MLTISGFRTLRESPPLPERCQGDCHVLVSPIGGPWGYTVWRGQVCATGRKDWNWTAEDACANAPLALEAQAVVG